jgi:hypothetical protein
VKQQPCTHIETIADVTLPRKHECEECVKIHARCLYGYPDGAFAEY